jgi:hypothetical protein
MHPEQIRPIEAENLEKHGEELEKRLRVIQLSFAERKLAEEKENDPELKFSAVMGMYTSLIEDLRMEYKKRRSKKEEGFGEFLQPIVVEIDRMYGQKKEGWQEEIIDLAFRKMKELGPVQSDGKKIPEDKKAGFIHYDIQTGNDAYEKYGIENADTILEIHFEEAYRQGSEINASKLKDSLELLAAAIVKQYPQTKHIIGRSWLLDHKIAERMGFKIIERTDSLDHGSTWWQFMDKNGQISKDRMERFAKTGELPFKVALGIIPVEEFLKKYLPDEMRGRVMLQEVKEEDKQKLADFFEQAKKLKEGFVQMSKEEVLSHIKSMPLFSENLEKAEMKELIMTLEEAKDSGETLDDFEKKNPERMRKIGREVDKMINRFSDKEIFIAPKKKETIS